MTKFSIEGPVQALKYKIDNEISVYSLIKQKKNKFRCNSH